MEPESSLPQSQQFNTCPYPETYEPSLCLRIPLLEDPYQNYTLIYAWVFQMPSFPQFFQ
jgi:hypothetical protein